MVQKTVLLVEPRKHQIAPMSLMKFSTWYKRKGYRVVLVTDIAYFHIPKKVDEIVVTSVFTFDIDKVISCIKYYKNHYGLNNEDVHVGGIAVSLMPEYIREHCGNVDIHVGLHPEVENLPLDYSLYPEIDYSLAYTSRGCVRKCPWCMVPVIEGKMSYVHDWEGFINMHKPRVQFFDNNFTACKKDWIEHVCKRLKYLDKWVDFNQSLDIRLFKEFHAKWLSQIKMECLRFSYDSTKTLDDQTVIDKVNLAKSYGFRDIRFDVLYNYDDTPEDFYHRLDVINSLDCKAFPMKYVPLNQTNRHYVGEHWTQNRLDAFNKLMQTGFSQGMLGNGKNSRNTFFKTFGKSGKEFVKNLDIMFIDKYGHIDDNQMTFEKFM
ncbi:MAG: hypothetical protein ACOCQD_00185 [archaeon]